MQTLVAREKERAQAYRNITQLNYFGYGRLRTADASADHISKAKADPSGFGARDDNEAKDEEIPRARLC
jgi:hypothetical protein